MRYPALILMLLATPCLAQLDPDPDSIGVYFDLAATQVVTTAPVGGEVAAYLIATNPSQAGGLAMWEGRVQASGAYAVVWGGPTSGFNVAMNMPGGNGFSFTVFGEPPLQQLAPLTVLAHLWIVPMEEGAIDLLLGSTTYRLEDIYMSPDYLLYPSSGSLDLPVASINGDPPVAAEVATWGEVKSLFRELSR